MDNKIVKKHPGVSVICSTNRQHFMNNILDNFLSQNYMDKELIIILNYNNPNNYKWNNKIKKLNNVNLYTTDSNNSLGKCLNFAISKSKYPIISKFDDDDYYSPNYLKNMVETLHYANAEIIGKACIYVYFYDKKTMAIKSPNMENKYVKRVHGSTLVFKRHILKNVKFKDKTLGEDMEFCKDCIKRGYKIYSNNKADYIYIRRNSLFHTWKIDNQYILNKCKIIGEIENYKDFFLGGRYFDESR